MTRVLAGAALAALLYLAGNCALAADNVTIGILTDFNGPYADLSGTGSVTAVEMAVKDFGGSVLGKPIDVVTADHQSKPDIAVAVARKWFDQGVNVIVDLSTSPVALAVQFLATEKKRIAITTTAATDSLTNEHCSPYGVHWTYDSYAFGKISSSLAEPGSTWFFVTADNAGGTALQSAMTPLLLARGAKVVGYVRVPLNNSDYSSFLLQAQSSGADYIVFAIAGADLQNAIKQAHEFGLDQKGQKLVAEVVFLTDVKAMGLEAAQGLYFGSGFLSTSTPEAAQWSKRFYDQHKAMPTDAQAGLYSAVSHYLEAVKAAGVDDADAVMSKMKEMPVHDMFTSNGYLRKDGRMIHDMYVVKAKSPAESKDPWDLFELVKIVPGEEAFRPLSESKCPLVSQSK